MTPPSLSLRRGIAANFAGQLWIALIGLVFLPVYLRYLGMEAYGLIGVFAIFQAWFTLLDVGMTPVLTREAARTRSGQLDSAVLRDLLRGTEVVFVALTLLIGVALMLLGPWVSTHWLGVARLSPEIVAESIVLMGLAACVRCLEGIYRGTALGLDRQVEINVAGATMATVRATGAVAVLGWVSPTITAFFWWQLIVSLLTVAWSMRIVYAYLGEPRRRPFSFDAWAPVGRFAGGTAGIAVLALLLTQADKVLLSRLLPLEAYGYYALAAVLANALFFIVTPISQALFPRFAALAGGAQQQALVDTYHRGAQLVAVLTAAPAWMLIVFGDVVLQLWIADAAIVQHTAPLLRLLAFGSLLNALMWIPYQLQLAHGHTRIALLTNLCAALLIVPALLWAVPRYGAIGGAWAWVALNAGYLSLAAPRMFKRLLPAERNRWYIDDLALPLLFAGAVAWLLRGTWPSGVDRLWGAVLLLAAGVLVLVAGALGASSLRAAARSMIDRRATRIAAR